MKYVFLLLASLIFSFSSAQSCQMLYEGSLCQNAPIKFTGDATGTSHSFDFNGEGTSSGSRIATHRFLTAGTKMITYITTINSVQCTSVLYLVIKSAPRIVLKKRSADTQCYEKNLFCFDDSTYNPNGAKMEEIVYNTNYGMMFTYKKPVLGASRCFSFVDQRGGALILYVTATDENGCVFRDTFDKIGYVHPKIGARFTRTSPKNPGCDSTVVNFTNTSGISSGNVKNTLWLWGDGNTSDKWGPNLSYTYKKQGTFNASLIIAANTGCTDTFTMNSTATNFSSKLQITSSADSVCMANSKIVFGLKENIAGITGFLWNFGDPSSGPLNFSNRTLSPDHTFTGLGPFQIKLTVSHPVCGNLTAFDTLLVLGPLSVMEVAGNRIPEYEVFQCLKDKQDTVHFKNFSRFYHNDKNYFNDDSIKIVNGVWQHVFSTQQISLKNAGYVEARNRGRGCAQRLWDFGDMYAPKCTTAKHLNQNVTSNCRYSLDSIPAHYYNSWDQIFLSHFKNEYFEEGVFEESPRTCSRLKIWPSDSFVVVDDTLLAIPASSADIATANSAPYKSISSRYFLAEKWFLGVGSRYINNYVDIKIPNGKSLEIVTSGGAKINLTGPATYALRPGQTINSANSTDSVEFLLTQYLLRDTMPLPFLRYRENKGQHFAIISQFIKTFSGVKGKDYLIDYNRFRQHYFSKIPLPFTAKLSHRDTCNKMLCASEAAKQIVMMNADAGSMGVGLRQISSGCLDGANTPYNATFILSDLKPGGSYSYAAINTDTNCSKNFVPFNAFAMGRTAPYTFYSSYSLNGNPSPYLHWGYTPNNVCGDNGCVTIGIVIGNGVSKSGVKPLCADTQYYEKMLCFPEMDTRFEVVGISKNSSGNYKICKGNDVSLRPVAGNKTDPHDLKSIKWSLKTENAGRNFTNIWEDFILEEYHFNEAITDSGNNKLYNYLVVSRGGSAPSAVPCSNVDQDNSSAPHSTPDTIITAVITKWDTAIYPDAVWDSTASLLRSIGFDPFAVSPTMLAKMIWNGVGTIGLPGTGALGCLDTTGFGGQIRYELVPDPAFTKILNYRDTSIIPLDSVFENGKWVRAYSLEPSFNGYHVASINLVSKSGVCDAYSGYPVVVGFAAALELPDSILALQANEVLYSRADFRYFHPDPINFGNWDVYDYWRDNQRILAATNGAPNRECISKWDWSKADDDPGNPPTIFSSGDYGAKGIGTIAGPWTTLGGGGLNAVYYKDTGVYILRLASCDSSQCTDTITRRIFVTGLEVDFSTSVTVPACNSVVEFFDDAKLHDPCKWAMPTCGGAPASCDFINFWAINWGDGNSNFYSRSGPADAGLPSNIAHKYQTNGWHEIKYFVKTSKGSVDTSSRWVKVPGPRPKFAITGTLSHVDTVMVGDSVEFINLTDSATPNAQWAWFFGDATFKATTTKSNVLHAYTAPGVYHVFLQQYDSLIVPPATRRYCPAIYPDTPSTPAYIIYVLPTTDVKVHDANGAVYAYPNPTKGTVHLEGAIIEKVIIYATDGREVYKGVVRNNEISIAALSSGLYMLKAITKEGKEHLISIIRED